MDGITRIPIAQAGALSTDANCGWRQRTLKAAIYVKELCRVMEFGLISLKPVGQSVCTLNCSIDPSEVENWADCTAGSPGLLRSSRVTDEESARTVALVAG